MVSRGDQLRLCVLDTGAGMSAEEIADFAGAYRKGAQSDGHGLGLSVCYELARDNGMELSCASIKNEGTVFILTIPALEQLEAA